MSRYYIEPLAKSLWEFNDKQGEVEDYNYFAWEGLESFIAEEDFDNIESYAKRFNCIYNSCKLIAPSTVAKIIIEPPYYDTEISLMKQILFLILLLFVFQFNSCKQETNTIYRTTYRYYGSVHDNSNRTVQNIDTLFYHKNKNHYLYRGINKNKVIFRNDSSLIYCNTKCNFINQKKYEIGSKSMIVKKFLYNTDSIDEETILFFSPSNGLLIEKNLWSRTIVLYNTSSNQLIIDAILNDAKGLSLPDGFIPKPPPIPKN